MAEDGAQEPAAARAAEEEFRSVVKAYIDLHDQLQESSKRMREIRKKKTELADVIMQYMKKNEVGECALRDGKLVLGHCKRLEPLKKEHILEELSKAVGSAQAENLLVGIYSKRGVSEKDTLRRTRAKAAAPANNG
jgi:hypothetical protein